MQRKDDPFKLTEQDKDAFFEIDEYVLKASKLSSAKQLTIICDATEDAAGYALLIEDYTDEEAGKTSKSAPAAFG